MRISSTNASARSHTGSDRGTLRPWEENWKAKCHGLLYFETLC